MFSLFFFVVFSVWTPDLLTEKILELVLATGRRPGTFSEKSYGKLYTKICIPGPCTPPFKIQIFMHNLPYAHMLIVVALIVVKIGNLTYKNLYKTYIKTYIKPVDKR